MSLILVIGNKNYSSWSMRPWLALRANKIPFEELGNDARQTLRDASALLQTLNTQVAPQAKQTMAAAQTALEAANHTLQPDSAVQVSTAEAMQELARTAAAFRTLADYLERHPEALLRGKPGQAEDNK